MQKVILITGCSSGIGYDAAFTLKKRGHRVIASCRKAEDVQRLISLGMETIQLDVDDSSSIHKAFKEVLEKTDGKLDVLINNAGYAQPGALEDISRDTLRQQFETNVFGLLELTGLAIPIMRKHGNGRIINLSSILGVISLPFRGAYNASKYAVEGLSDTLRLELKPSGIDVITIEPGPIESRFRENCLHNSLHGIDMKKSYFSKHYETMLATYKHSSANAFFTQKADAVSKKLIHAIEARRPKVKYPVTIPAHVLIFIKRFLSERMMDRLLSSFSKKETDVE